MFNKLSIELFQKEIEDIKKYIEIVETKTSLLKNYDNYSNSKIHLDLLSFLRKNIDNNNLLRKKEYSSVIVLTYKSLESYLENVIQEYLKELSLYIKEWEAFPKAIRDNHQRLSADLMKSLTFAKYSHIHEKDVVHNMSSIYSNEIRLNLEAYTHHSYNFRDSNINAFFLTIGISDLLKLVEADRSWQNYQENKGSKKTGFSFLNELSDRRNILSHGGPIDDILNMEALLELIELIEQFVKSLDVQLELELLKYLDSKGLENFPLKIMEVFSFQEGTKTSSDLVGIRCINQQGLKITKYSHCYIKKNHKYEKIYIQSIGAKSGFQDEIEILTTDETYSLKLSKGFNFNTDKLLILGE